jgi:hypothetical protein
MCHIVSEELGGRHEAVTARSSWRFQFLSRYQHLNFVSAITCGVAFLPYGECKAKENKVRGYKIIYLKVYFLHPFCCQNWSTLTNRLISTGCTSTVSFYAFCCGTVEDLGGRLSLKIMTSPSTPNFRYSDWWPKAKSEPIFPLYTICWFQLVENERAILQ